MQVYIISFVIVLLIDGSFDSEEYLNIAIFCPDGDGNRSIISFDNSCGGTVFTIVVVGSVVLLSLLLFVFECWMIGIVYTNCRFLF